MNERINNYERDTVVPLIAFLLVEADGRVLSAGMLADGVRRTGHICNTRMVRVCVNHIRRNNIIPCLAATNKGYFVAHNDCEITETINSLEGRVESIQEVISALKEQRYIKFNH